VDRRQPGDLGGRALHLRPDLLAPVRGGGLAAPWRLHRHVASISAPDKYTFVVKNQNPLRPLPGDARPVRILPKHVLSSLPAAAINTADWNSAPTVTNGPFKFVRWDKGAQVVYQKKPRLLPGAPHLDQFVYKVVPSTTAVADQLKTGELDAGTGRPSQVATMQAEQSIGLTGFATPSFQFYMQQLNPDHPPGRSLPSRRSARDVLRLESRGDGQDRKLRAGPGRQLGRAVHLLGPQSNAKPVYGYNPSRANQLLDQAGWQKGSDGSGPRTGGSCSSRCWYANGNRVRQRGRDHAAELEGDRRRPHAEKHPVRAAGHRDHQHPPTSTSSWSGSTSAGPDEAQLFSSAGTAAGGFNGFDSGTTRWTSS